MKLIRHLSPTGPAWAALQPDGLAVVVRGDLANGFVATDERVAPGPRLAPVDPVAIYGVGLNYHAHARQLGRAPEPHPLIFMKSPASIQHPGQPILVPSALPCHALDYEGELAVVIGRAAKNVPPERALDHVLGYTIANDVADRAWQFQHGGGQFCQGKSFDTFCPLGPVLITPDELPAGPDLPLRTWVNDELRQEGRTGDMIFNVAHLIAFLSAGKTLPSGTVILTGTPGGAGHGRTPPVYLRPGDVVRVEIEGLGILQNPVAPEPVAHGL